MNKMPICDKCKCRPLPLNDGQPNAIGFKLESGKVVTLCRRCLIKLGEAQESGRTEEWDEFFREANG